MCDGHLKQFLDDSVSLSPEERGELLQKAEGIINAHKEIGREGQTEVFSYIVDLFIFRVCVFV